MRYIRFDCEISEESTEDLLTKVREMNAPNHVHINSPGGEFELFSVLGPAIERQGLITSAGDVGSAAVILFLLGHKRQALPDAMFFFHEVRALVGPSYEITITGLERVEECKDKMADESKEVFEEWLLNMRNAQYWFLRFLKEKTGLATSRFLDLMRSEATLSAKEAVQYGIVHEVLPGNHLEDGEVYHAHHPVGAEADDFYL